MIQSRPVTSETLPAAPISACAPLAPLGHTRTGDRDVPPPRPPPARRRRKRSRPRALRAARRVGADRASAWACSSGAQPRAGRAPRGAPVGRARGSAATTPAMHALLSDRGAQAREPRALRAHLPRGRRDGRRSQASRAGEPRTRRRRRLRPAGRDCRRGSSARLRGTRRAADGRATSDGAGRRLARRARRSPACAAASSCTRETTLPPRGGDPGARRHAARQGRRTGCRTSGRWPPRSPAASAPRRPSAPPSSPRRGVPDGRAGRPHRPRARVRRAARRHARRHAARRRRACSRAPQPQRRRRRAHDDRPRHPARRGRGARRALRRHRGAAARAPARCSRSPGIAFSAPQPPGLDVQDRHARRRARGRRGQARGASFPVQTETTLEGVELQNANGESCGGSLESSFADSCNSVFAPLGAKLGAERLVATAERFGFNQEPGPVGAARSTIPAAGEIGDDLAVGSTAIGQGKVLATPLRDGRRSRRRSACAAAAPRRRCSRGAQGKRDARRPRRAPPASIARFMRAVVTYGTGVGAAIPGVKVAGKTGTAELRTHGQRRPAAARRRARRRPRSRRRTRPTPTPGSPPSRPTAHPRVAVGVLLVGQGAGGETAAPAAKTVHRGRARR